MKSIEKSYAELRQSSAYQEQLADNQSESLTQSLQAKNMQLIETQYQNEKQIIELTSLAKKQEGDIAQLRTQVDALNAQLSEGALRITALQEEKEQIRSQHGA